MLGSPILDLAIGMAFIYLLLSLIASVIQETIATITQARPANLARGMQSLFSGDPVSLDEKGDTKVSFMDAVYKHGLIRGLYQDPKLDSAPGAAEPPPPRRFANFLRRLLMKAPPFVSNVDNFLLPAYIPARTFALAVTDLLNDKSKGGTTLQNVEGYLLGLKAKSQQKVDDVVAAAKTAGVEPHIDPCLYENKAAEALLTLVHDAGTDVEQFRTNLENWYNDSMDRASGWYKRHTQRILMIVGFCIAVVFNVDSIRVARTLWFDHDARAGLANAASQYIQTHPDFASTQPKGKPAANGAAPAPGDAAAAQNPDAVAASAPDSGAPAVQAASTSSSFNPDDLKTRLNQTVDSFNEVSQKSMLPVGWRHHFPEDYWHALPGMPASLWIRQLLLALLGWAITAGALSLGAPFWFDTLNKFMVVRNTIKPAEKSQTEPSKD